MVIEHRILDFFVYFGAETFYHLLVPWTGVGPFLVTFRMNCENQVAWEISGNVPPNWQIGTHQRKSGRERDLGTS